MDNIERELLGLLNEVLRHKRRPELAAIVGDPHFRDDLHLDSLDLAELTVRIEERFGIDVFEEGVVSRFNEIQARIVRHAAGRK
jgi:acyl carrier protein